MIKEIVSDRVASATDILLPAALKETMLCFRRKEVCLYSSWGVARASKYKHDDGMGRLQMAMLEILLPNLSWNVKKTTPWTICPLASSALRTNESTHEFGE